MGPIDGSWKPKMHRTLYEQRPTIQPYRAYSTCTSGNSLISSIKNGPVQHLRFTKMLLTLLPGQTRATRRVTIEMARY